MRERKQGPHGGGKRMASSKLLVKIQDPLADRGQVLQTVKLLSGAHFSRVQLSRGKQIVKSPPESWGRRGGNLQQGKC